MAQNTPASSWPAGFVIRPAVDPDGDRIEVADVVTGRRFHWHPQALAEKILAQQHQDDSTAPAPAGPWADALNGGSDRAALVAGWKHWLDRGWHPSDQSYIASRRWQYADTTDSGDQVRSQTIEGYVRTGGAPPQEVLPDVPAVPLGEPPVPGSRSVGALLAGRRSGRAYVPQPTPLPLLSGLLWHGLADIRVRRERTSPDQPLSYLDSFGSAWDCYVTAYGVDSLPEGAYRYDLTRHQLLSVRPGNHREAMSDILQGMRSPATAAWTIGLVADLPRYQWRYRHEHALRRLWFEAGLIGQELIVLGASYGLSTLVTPAQKDRPYLSLHQLDDRRYTAVYTLTMGMSRGRAGVEFNGHPIEQIPAGT